MSLCGTCMVGLHAIKNLQMLACACTAPKRHLCSPGDLLHHHPVQAYRVGEAEHVLLHGTLVMQGAVFMVHSLAMGVCTRA